MRCGGCVLLTAISTISFGLRPARRAAAAIRSCVDAMLAAMDMGGRKIKTFAARRLRARVLAPHNLSTTQSEQPHDLSTTQTATSWLSGARVRWDRRRRSPAPE